MEKWTRTDDMQLVKVRNENEYDIIETINVSKNYDRYIVQFYNVDFDDYNQEQILYVISSYGYESIDEIKEAYGEDEYKQVIAECIAETYALTEGQTIFEGYKEDVGQFLNEVINGNHLS